jgi:uncharacterized membrane protein
MKELFLKKFKEKLKKYFSEEESNNIVSYYSEQVDERILAGEKLDDIINSLDINQIIKDLIPLVIYDRKEKNLKESYNTFMLGLIRAIKIPVFFPIMLVSLILIFVFTIIYLLGFLFLIISPFSIFYQMLDFFVVNYTYLNVLLNIGTGLIVGGVFALIGVLFIKSSKFLITSSARLLAITVGKKRREK